MDALSIKCLKPILKSMKRKELEYLYYISLEGKKVFEKFEDFSGDKDMMEEINSYFNFIYSEKNKIPFFSEEPASKLSIELLVDKIIEFLEDNIVEGIGIIDRYIKGLNNYVNQLKLTIETITNFYLKDIEKKPTKYRNIKIKDYVEGLKDIRENLLNIKDKSCETAEELEETLALIMIQNYISTLSNEELKIFQDEIKKELEKLDLSTLGIDNASTITPALLIGNLILLRKILGFTFHKILAIVLNAVSKTLLGKGLSFAANAAVQKYMATLLTGPYSWILMTLLTIPTIFDLINPRRFDRYIPVVLFIYYKRKELDNFWEEMEKLNSID